MLLSGIVPAFLWLCLGKTNLCSHVTFMRVPNVSGMLLCILDGSECVVCLSDVTGFSCRVVFVSVMLLPFSRWWLKQIRLAVKRVMKGSKLWVWGKTCHAWHMVWITYMCSGRLDIPGLRYDYLCIFVEPCCVEMFIVCYCRCQWNGFPWHDLWISSTVGHVYGIAHVSLFMVW